MNKSYKNTITATELKTNLGKYLNYAIANHEVIITKNGKKAARLSPYITDIERYFTIKEEALDYQYGGKKVSYDEFMEIYEKSNMRMEFINGEIYLLASPSPFHQEISGRLFLMLAEYLKGKKCKAFYAPFDVHFNKKGFKEPDVMQPDLFVACDLEDTVNEKGRYMGTPSLVIEILSPDSRSKDMVDKLNTYMISAVREYWVIDPKKKNIMLYGFKELEVDEFSNFNIPDILVSYFFEGLKIDLSEVFRP